MIKETDLEIVNVIYYQSSRRWATPKYSWLAGFEMAVWKPNLVLMKHLNLYQLAGNTS